MQRPIPASHPPRVPLSVGESAESAPCDGADRVCPQASRRTPGSWDLDFRFRRCVCFLYVTVASPHEYGLLLGRWLMDGYGLLMEGFHWIAFLYEGVLRGAWGVFGGSAGALLTRLISCRGGV